MAEEKEIEGKITEVRTIRRAGKSLSMTIGPDMIKKMGLEYGSKVRVTCDNGRMCVEKKK